MTNETERKITPKIQRQLVANEEAYRETMREPKERFTAARRAAMERFSEATSKLNSEKDAKEIERLQAVLDDEVREASLRLRAIDNEAQETRRIADFEAWEGEGG